jgi:hypothetical protein
MQQINRWEVRQTLEVVILPPIEAPPPRYGQIYIINFGPPPTRKQYEVTIGNFPQTCVDFIEMMASSLGSWGEWVHYKLFTKNKFILKVSSNMNYYDEFHPF